MNRSPAGGFRRDRDRIAAKLAELRGFLPAVRAKHGAGNARVERLERVLGAVACVVEAMDLLVPDSETMH